MNLDEITFLVTNATCFDRSEHDRMVLAILNEPVTLDTRVPPASIMHTIPSLSTFPLVIDRDTRIRTLGTTNHIVFLVDLSGSSMADETNGKVKPLSSVAFETLCKCIDGVIQPFEIGDTASGSVVITPQITVTVINRCKKTVNTDLVKLPEYKSAFKVLAQEFAVTRLNFDLFIEYLHNVMLSRNDLSINDSYNDESATVGTFTSLDIILHYIDASSKNALQSAVLITDGVTSSASHSEMLASEHCRKIARLFVAFSIIQVGSPVGFHPAVSFGCVADTEFIHSIALACGGSLLNSSDCEYPGQISELSISAPNFYHKKLLFRETSLNKAISSDIWSDVYLSTALRSVNSQHIIVEMFDRAEKLNGVGMKISESKSRFPWTVDSMPPDIALRQFSMHSYSVFSPALSHIMTARLLEGFFLFAIRPIVKLNREPKIEITFMLPWLPEVLVFYKVRCYQSQCNGVISASQRKSPQIELVLLAAPAFIRLLLNNAPNQLKTRTIDKIEKFQKYISGLFDSDMLFKSFTGRCEELKMLKFDLNGQDEQRLESNLTYIHDTISRNAISFQQTTLHVILRSTSFRPSGSNQMLPPSSEHTRRHIAATYLMEYLSQWSTFTVDKLVFLRCEDASLIYLAVSFENDFVVRLQISFVNVSIIQRMAAINEITTDLNAVEHASRGVNFRPIRACQRNIDRYILLNDTESMPQLELYYVSRAFVWLSSNPLFFVDVDLFLNAAKQALTYHRLSEGYTPIFESATKTVFYKEISNAEHTIASLYTIECDPSAFLFSASLSIEPYHTAISGISIESVDEHTLFSHVFELLLLPVATQIEQRDQAVINQLLTFNRLRQLIDMKPPSAVDSFDVDLTDTLKSSQVIMIGLPIPSLETLATFYEFLCASLSAVTDIQITDAALLANVLEVINELGARLKDACSNLSIKVMAKLLSNNTVLLLAIPLLDNCSTTLDSIVVHAFILQLPSISPKTAQHQSVTAFERNIPAHTEHFVRFDSTHRFTANTLLTGTHRYDSNHKQYNTIVIMETLVDAYKSSVVKSIYSDLSRDLNVPADHIKTALDFCSDLLVSMDVSDFLRLTPIDSSDVSFNAALSEIIAQHFSPINSGTYWYTLRDGEHASEPLFLSIEICLQLDDSQTAHFDLSTTDIGHIRENYAVFKRGSIQLKWRGCFFPAKRSTTTAVLSGIAQQFSGMKITTHHQNAIESLYVAIRSFLDSEILYSLLHKDLKSLSLRFISETISRLSDFLLTIAIPSDVAQYIRSHPSMQTFAGRIAPVFIGDFKSSLTDFFIYFFSCKCFQSILQVGSNYVLKYSTHDNATDVLSLDCDDSITLKDDLFWLILSTNGSFIDVQFYARNMNTMKTSTILQLLVNRIFRMIKKVNQRTLLHELNETRRASKILIPSNAAVSEDSSDEDSDSSTSNLRNLHYYASGELACSNLFTHTIPIHWRLKAASAINYILSSLQPLAISNRPNMLIYSTDNGSYYIAFGSKEVSMFDQALKSVEEQVIVESDQTKWQSSLETPSRQSQHGSATPKTALDFYILMSVFGVDQPSADERRTLIQLAETRLSNLLQQTISAHLSRNLTPKLTQADIQFILPVPKRATRSLLIRLSNTIDLSTLMMCLSQSVSAFMSQMPTIEESLRNYLLGTFGQSSITNAGGPEQGIGDLAFMYSAVSSRSPSTLETQFGVGIMSAVLVLLDAKKKILARLPATSLNPALFESQFHNFTAIKEESHNDHFLAVEVWSCGNINIDAVCEKIEASLEQSRIDCCIEICLEAHRLCSYDSAESQMYISSALDAGCEYFPASFFKLTSDIFLPLWMSNIFVQDLARKATECISGCTVKFDTVNIDSLIAIHPECEYSSFVGTLSITALSVPLVDAGKETRDRGSINQSKRSSPVKLIDGSSTDSLNSPARLNKRTRSTSLAPLNMGILDSPTSDAMILSGVFDQASSAISQRHFLADIKVANSQLIVRTYNLAKSQSDLLFNEIVNLLSWNSFYIKYLKMNSLGPTIKIDNLFISRISMPDFTTYKDAYNYGNMSQRLNETKPLVDPTKSQHSLTNSISSNKIIKAFQDFLLNHVWCNRSRFIALATTADTMSPLLSASTEYLSRTPRSQSFQLNDYDSVADKMSFVGTDLIAILRTVQIEDIFKYPLLFSQKRNELFGLDISSSRFTANERKFRLMLTQWFEHFAAYLHYLEFVKVAVTTSSETFYDAHDELRIKTDVLFFTQEVVCGTVFVELAVDGIFASLNVYSLATDPFICKDFPVLTNQLIRKVHFHSLAYDFHLRIIQQVLEAPIAVFSINIINVLNTFITFNNQKAPLARCRIVKQSLEYENIDSSICAYIFNEPHRYGFKPVYFNDEIIASYITTSSPLFASSDVSLSPYTHTIIVYYTQSASGTVELSCFVMLLDTMNLFPDERDMVAGDAKADTDDYIHSGFYLLDIVRNGVKQVDAMIDEARSATQLYKRDTLWRAMIDQTLNETSHESHDQSWFDNLVEKLSNHATPVTTTYFNLVPFFADSRIPWTKIFSHFESKFQSLAFYDSYGTSHLILPSQSNTDYALKFSIDNSLKDRTVRCETVSREIASTSAEADLVDQTFKEISALLFRLSYITL